MGDNFIGANQTTGKIRLYVGFTSSVTTTLTLGVTTLTGVTWDGTDLYDNNHITNLRWHRVGFSTSFYSNIAAPSAVIFGNTIDDTYSYSSDNSNNTQYQHPGFTTTINASFSNGSNSGDDCTHDGTDYTTTARGGGSPLVRLHLTFSSTVQSSFDPGFTAVGVTWDGTDLYLSLYLASGSKWKKMVGRSSTLDTEFNSTDSAYAISCTWENYENRIGAGGASAFIPKTFII